MATPLVELRGVTYGINGKKIIDDVSWTVREGENWAILGPNGAGKTTLLRLMCGYLWPNGGGEVLRNGEAHVDLGTLRRSIGWVTSTLLAHIPRGERVLDTVLSGMYAQLGLWPSSDEQPSAEAAEAAARCLDHLGCADLSGHVFGTLSQGEQQKVLVCRALMAEPYLLVLDEPCAGMDPGAREAFLSALSTTSARKKPSRPHLRDPPPRGDHPCLYENPCRERWRIVATGPPTICLLLRCSTPSTVSLSH